MKIRLAIPKKINLVAEELREPWSLYSEKEIEVPVYEILKALNIDINERTEGNDILAKINELKSNKFNRIEDIMHKRVQTGVEYRIGLDIGEPKLAYCLYMGIYDSMDGYIAIKYKVEGMAREILDTQGILLNELELKQIEGYIQKHN